MANVDEQISRIEAMLQQILTNMGEAPQDEDEDEGCPYCGGARAHRSGESPMRGKTFLMITKKKPGDPLPSVLKDILDAMVKGGR